MCAMSNTIIKLYIYYIMIYGNMMVRLCNGELETIIPGPHFYQDLDLAIWGWGFLRTPTLYHI
jgi:hypothetical protein